MKPDDEAATMQAFVSGDIHVLVATTVIEVGVDVPRASVAVIGTPSGSASRNCTSCAGASAGRRSTCVLLFEEPLTDTAKQRLKVIFETTDGFEIARQDLLIRGPGEFLGARQSGVPMLRFADIERDVALIEQARDAAAELLDTDPVAAEAHLDRWLGGKQAFIKA
jgi:ATP-dependent DNA helicase RecG